MYILGINAVYHESAACLIRDGEVLLAVEEERFNRMSHGKIASPANTALLPYAAMDECLRSANISLSDCAHIGYSFDPEILHAGAAAWRAANPTTPTWKLSETSYQTLEGSQAFLGGVLGTKEQLRAKGFKGTFHYLSHHECHAASAFNVSPFEKAAVAVIDGIGEWASASLYLGNGRHLSKFKEYQFPNSIGFLWEKLSMYLGFTQYDASKVMGLAAYGDPDATRHEFAKLVMDGDELTVDASLLRHESPDFGPLERLFGLPKRTSRISDAADPAVRGYVNIAASLQRVTEERVLHILNSFDTNEYRKLCLAGGVALNCAMNGRVVREGLFEDVFIQPASHDAGTALGAAMLVWNKILGRERAYVMRNAYLGPSYAKDEVERELEAAGLEYRAVDNIAVEVARLIADGKIVGWFNGRMEWGPRALGNRSLLADPRNRNVREVINVKVKHRELYRPFCPSVLAERAPEWFASGGGVDANKYMLTTSEVLQHKRELIPAVVHVDGSARAQEVHEADNPEFYTLISEFEKLTGIPMLLNTSFNDCEPIVCSPRDAIKTFQKTGIDCLAIDGFITFKPGV